MQSNVFLNLNIMAHISLPTITKGEILGAQWSD